MTQKPSPSSRAEARTLNMITTGNSETSSPPEVDYIELFKTVVMPHVPDAWMPGRVDALIQGQDRLYNQLQLCVLRVTPHAEGD